MTKNILHYGLRVFVISILAFPLAIHAVSRENNEGGILAAEERGKLVGQLLSKLKQKSNSESSDSQYFAASARLIQKIYEQYKSGTPKYQKNFDEMLIRTDLIASDLQGLYVNTCVRTNLFRLVRSWSVHGNGDGLDRLRLCGNYLLENFENGPALNHFRGQIDDVIRTERQAGESVAKRYHKLIFGTLILVILFAISLFLNWFPKREFYKVFLVLFVGIGAFGASIGYHSQYAALKASHTKLVALKADFDNRLIELSYKDNEKDRNQDSKKFRMREGELARYRNRYDKLRSNFADKYTESFSFVTPSFDFVD